jgi:transcriptional regulator with XRE-family HTH domain
MPVDCQEALRLRTENGLTYPEIAAIMNVSKQAVHQQVSKLIPTDDYIEPFKKNRANILAHAQAKALEAFLSLDLDEQKQMVKRRGLVDMGISYDKERTELGLVNEVIDVRSMCITVDAKIQELQELLKVRPGEQVVGGVD